MVFEDEKPNPILTIKMAVESAGEFAGKNHVEDLVNNSNFWPAMWSLRSRSIWSGPPFDVVKVNCDGAFDGQRMGCGGFIFRDWNGLPLMGRFVNFMGDDVLSIEGKAVFHALLIARRMGFERL